LGYQRRILEKCEFYSKSKRKFIDDTFVLQLFGSEILTGMFILGFFRGRAFKEPASVICTGCLAAAYCCSRQVGYLLSVLRADLLIAGVVLYLAVKNDVGQQ